ncbi:germination protein M [Paenibacillus sp. UNCCL117]|uniref:GerMN domain-containing protein n=1 Tax=unclassified Paenibacillus TaxID=185978 RepID=UPI00088D6894|nr:MULTISPECIES: GerMN domain-containing protein [unclassified Paenibacillus]SDD26130.1 germination protein M [Paenibacillus sp. cl123]SFW41148.1 germination protein M [Paenibacillus sp. UNCCL117]
MKPNKPIRWAAVTGLIMVMTTGCSMLETKEQSRQIDPPQGGVEAKATSGHVSVPELVNPMQLTVYAKDEKGFVAPVTVQIEKAVDTAKKALEYMVDGGPAEGRMPAGFRALLPKGTEVKGINIIPDQKLAVVDFSKSFHDYNLQDERKILEAVTWTLTGYPTVEKVRIRVEGADIKEMPVGGTPLDEPLSRAMGINLEKPESVEYGQATPVTLYFLSRNQEDYHYYVPVTRLINRTDQISEAVVQQLIAGPDDSKGLAAVLNAGSELLQITSTDDVITVNFSDKMLGPDLKAPAEALKAVVLSLTENEASGKKVQILVNGDAKVSATDNQSYAKPVARPSTVNPGKL